MNKINELVEFGGQIVESSGNSYRLANGIQISFGATTTNSTYGSANIEFSLPFRAAPGVSITNTLVYQKNCTSGFYQGSYTTTGFTAYTLQNGEPYSATIAWIAIGTWK